MFHALMGFLALQAQVIQDVDYLGAARTPKMDLFVPPPLSNGALSPAMVVIHGGGWMLGDKGDSLALETSRNLATAGYVVADINYELGPGAWPQDLFDSKNAVRYLRSNASRLKIDPNRIGVLGGSAGGHLALMTGFTSGMAGLEPTDNLYPNVSSSVRCVVDMCGPGDLEIENRRDVPCLKKALSRCFPAFGSPSLSGPVYHQASPVNYIRPSVPPVMVLQSEDDPIMDTVEAHQVVAALQQSGVPVRSIFLSNGGHYFNLHLRGNRQPLERDLRSDTMAFLAESMPLPGSVEGEDLKLISNSGGSILTQEVFWFLSGGKQLWWKGGQVGDRLKVSFSVAKAGTYQIGGNFCFAHNYGTMKIKIGSRTLAPIDFYSPRLTWKYMELGTFSLPKGEAEIEAQISTPNPEAIPGNMFGVDYLWIRK